MPVNKKERDASTPGRKPIFNGDSHIVFVRFSKPAAERIQERAAAEGSPMSTWIRSVVMRELEK